MHRARASSTSFCCPYGREPAGRSSWSLEADERGDLPDPFAVPALLAGGGRQPQSGGDEPGAGQPVAAEHQAVGDGGARRQGEVLEGAGDAEAGDAVRGRPVSSASPKRTLPEVAR